MKTVIGMYESHDAAEEAVRQLQSAGYPADKVSIVGHAEMVDEHLHVKATHNAERAEVSVGVVAGSILGVLTGVGVFAIPGLGFLFGAGALVGAIAGVDLGIIGGGLTAIFTSMGIEKAHAAKYEKMLKAGSFMVIVQGEDDEVTKAETILGDHNTHLELERN